MNAIAYLFAFAILCITIICIFGIFRLIKVKAHNVELDRLEQEQKDRISASKIEAEKVCADTEKIKIQAQNEIAKLNDTKENLNTQIAITKNFAEEQATNYYNAEIAKADTKIQSAIDTMYASLEREGQAQQKQHLLNIQKMKKEYQQMREEATNDFSIEIKQKKQELLNLETAIGILKSYVNAATEENKRAKLNAEEKNYYRIIISKEDIEEIAKIRSIEPYLRDKEVLNKLIWSEYYKKPTNDMCNRVVGMTSKTGIYKLTNILDGMVYVGQAVSIGDRFIQHVKRGVGADSPGKNKLYPAMLEAGVENFTFEILEECLPEELNDREKYWIDFYNGMEYGYNLRIG